MSLNPDQKPPVHPAIETRPMAPPGADPFNSQHTTPLTSADAGSATIWLGVLLMVALGLRLMVFVLGPAGDIELAQHVDSPRYVELAEHLSNDHQFALKAEPAGSITEAIRDLRAEAGELEVVYDTGLQPEIFRTPGYPAFLAAFQWMGLSAHAVLIVQCMLGALCVLLTYQLTRSLFNSAAAGLIAATIMALHPGAIAYANIMLPDMLWLTLMLGGLWMIVSAPALKPTSSLAIGGLLLGAAALVQPYMLILLLALAVWFVLQQRTLRSIGPAIVMLIMACLGPGLWMARNHTVGFGPYLSSEPIVDRYFHTVADMHMLEQEGDLQTDWAMAAEALLTKIKAEKSENETVFDAMSRLTRSIISTQPALYAQTLKRDTVLFFTDHSLGSLYQQLGISYESPHVSQRILTGGFSADTWTGTRDDATGLIALIWMGANALLLVASIVGMIIMIVRGKWLATILLVGLTGYILIDLHNAAYERLHIAVLGFQAAMIAAMAIPHPRPRKGGEPKKTRAQKKAEKYQRKQMQTLGVEEDVKDLTHDHDPIIPGPGSGPKEGLRPI